MADQAGEMTRTAQSARSAASAARFARAVGGAAAAYAVLTPLHYFPSAVDMLLAALVGVFMFLSTAGGIVAYVLVLALPLTYANPLFGVLALLFGFTGLGILSENNGAWFFVFALGPVAATAHALWAIPLLAGLYLGGIEGFLGGLLSCVAVEVLALLAGTNAPGLIVPMGPKTLIEMYRPLGPAPGLGNVSWVVARVVHLATLQGTVAELARLFTTHLTLVVQPMIWGAIGAIGGMSMNRNLRRDIIIVIGLGVALVVPMAGLARITAIGLTRVPMRDLAVNAVIGIAVALVWVYVGLKLAEAKRAAAAEAALAGMPTSVAAAIGAQTGAAAASAPATAGQSEQDVVELLRTIATAQDVIKEKFTQTATVLLTDMKEFSKLTHEQGSLPGASTVQRYRDLLLPVIEAHSGRGRPTGGDGIVAAFGSADDAVETAIEMQRTLANYNETHPTADQILIRIGLHTGELVFDKDSNPFIGDALNVASRVMNLADAGQIFVGKETKEASTRGESIDWFDHGTRKLRGIKEEVAIYEILWAAGQQPRPPDPSRQ
jgi:class 3 adenylate cyclase